MSNWRKSNRRIGKRRAIENKVDGTVGLSGRHGEIWHFNDKGTSFGAVITGVRIANKLAPTFKKTPDYKKGDEMLIFFGPEHLAEIIKEIGVPVSQATQIRLAEEFGK